MMSSSVSRNRRAIILLVSGLSLYLMASLAVLPAYDRLKTASEISAEKEVQLQKYKRVLLRKDRYAQLMTDTRASVSELRARMIQAGNTARASAELQALVDDVAKRTAIDVSQKTVTEGRKTDKSVIEVTVTLAFECAPRQLTDFLAELRQLPKFVTVNSLQIAPKEQFVEMPKGGDYTKHLRVNMTVAALSIPSNGGRAN